MAGTRKDTRPFRVDTGSFSYVAICEIDGCSYRGVTNTRGNAWRMMERHIKRTHPGYSKAANQARQNGRMIKK